MRAAILCPGRGSYTERTLGSLPANDERVRRADALRAEYGLEALSALDGAKRFAPATHLKPAHVSPLIYLVSVLHCERIFDEYDVTCVGGNSLGWYTALAVGGALSFDDGFRLVQEMSLLQQELATAGGQILYPLVDEDWRPDRELAEQVRQALGSSSGEAFASIDLGGYAVLAGSETGIVHLLRSLKPVKRRSTSYPVRLAQHGPYHTPLVRDVASRARETLSRLDFRAPRTTLIDGRGARFTPASTDPAELLDYTLGAQITEPFSFTRTVRVTLREHAPDRLVLPGPGNTLGGVCGQILASEGWRGIRSRADFDRIQGGVDPVVHSTDRR
jgi:malonyl CoA-acyl carrier protein transacylase